MSLGKRAVGGGPDLSTIFPQLRGDVRESERRVNLFLGRAGDPVVVGDAEEAVLVQLQSPL